MALKVVNDAKDHCAFIKKIILVLFIGGRFWKYVTNKFCRECNKDKSNIPC